VTSRDRMSRVEHSTHILRSFYFVKLGNLPNSMVKVERVNSIELKFDSTIILIKVKRYAKIQQLRRNIFKKKKYIYY
jgi:hypothetical protein